MSSAWAAATIEEFEQVSLENGTELFRVRARGRVGDDPEPRPVLACGAPGDPHSYEPLSSGGDRRGLLRLAYAVPTGLAGPSATFALWLPDGTRIDLPSPTPGPSRADMRRGRRADDVPRRAPEPDPAEPRPWEPRPWEPRPWEPRPSEPRPEPAPASDAPARDEGASERIRGLERERERLQHRVAEMTDAHAALRAEHTRLTRRLRQHEARFELLRADARRIEAAFGPGSTARLRRLEAEREQLVGHARALAELLAVSGPAAGPDRYPAANGAAERVTAARDRAVRAAHEQAERDLEQMHAHAES